MSGEIYDIAKRAVHVFINTGSVPYYVAEQVQRDVLHAGWTKKPKPAEVAEAKASALEEAADAAQADGLTTAAEVIYDLRRQAAALRIQ